MATSPLVNATKPIGGSLTEEQSPAESNYQMAMERILGALDAREGRQQQDILLALAQGMLTPGKTGSFGESVGQAAGNVRELQKQHQKEELDNAQMRLQLAQAGREQGNKTKAMTMAAQAMGMTPEALQQGLSSGAVTPGQISKINSGLYMAIANLDPKVGEALKNAYQMDVENAKIAVDLYGKGVQRAELEAKFGKGILDMLPPAPLSGGAPKTAAPGAPVETSKPKVVVDENEPQIQSQRLAILNQELKKAEGSLASATDDAQKMRAQGDVAALRREISALGKTPETKTTSAAVPAGEKVNEAIQDDLAWLPMETQNKIRADRQKDIDAPYSEKRKAITAFDPQYVSTSNARLKELYQLANQHPEIFGLMQEKGFFNALGSAAQQGSQTPWGTWSLPVTTFVQKMKLSPEQQTIATRASQLLAEQFFENAKTNKAVLGPSISNADVLLLKAPVATAEDSADAIKYWVKQSRLANAQKLDLYDALNNFDQAHGAKAAPGAFFSSKNPNYGGIVQKYETLADQLVRMHSPAWIPKPKDKQ